MPTNERALADAWATRRTASAEEEPVVSIVIPVYNQIDVTARCLQSIAETWFDSLRVQVIVVDDGSSDQTSEAIARLAGVDYVRNGTNLGFVRACNRGAAVARGRYVCFLNNDTTVTAAWLDHLVSTAEADPRVGAVGAKLVYPNGKLQEAGGIIWRDASGWNYGRNGNPSDSRYNVQRDVDYCSGAALLVRRNLFEELGGFSEEFAPAYYEDADLCFAIRDRGFRVVYQPRSEVIHYEGLTAGTDLSAGMKRFQEINRPKFLRKWSAVLALHNDSDAKIVDRAAHRIRHGPTMLIVDSYVPMYDRDAGSARLMELIRILRAADFQIFFLGDNYAAHQPYTTELQDLGVNVLHHIEGGMRWHDALDSVLPLLDVAWICRPELFEKYEPLIRRNSATKLIYDTIDLHFLRMRREAELTGASSDAWRHMEKIELAAARAANATVVVSGFEKQLLEDRGIKSVYVIPTVHDPVPNSVRAYEDTTGLLFIGGYNHTPNVDAVQWLCKEIMPIVWRSKPDMALTLLGSNPPPEVLALESTRVRVPGFIHDVNPYFARARIFVAPLRFGAGMKGKVGQALSHGLPTVLTGVAAEGFPLADNGAFRRANEVGDFAAAILDLYDDKKQWEAMSKHSIEALAPVCRAAVAPRLTELVMAVTGTVSVVTV